MEKKEVREVGEVLKRNLPEYLQGRDNLDSYLEACSEILGYAKKEIHDFRNHKDYEKATGEMVTKNLDELGFDIPEGIRLDVKRQILRDVMEIHKRRGTEDGIRQSLRILGLDSDVRQGWAVNADRMREGWVTTVPEYTERTFTGGEMMYLDLLYGDVVDDAEGAKFVGYQYWDTQKVRPTPPMAIIGETYVDGFTSQHTAEATPYVVVEFVDDGVFLVNDTESVDPETGETFPYTVSERFELLEDVVRFFIKGKYRPTTMRVIVVTIAMGERNTIVYKDSIKLTIDEGWDGDPNYEESLEISDQYSDYQTTTTNDTGIGDDANMTTDGHVADHFHLSMMTIGNVEGDKVGVYYPEGQVSLRYIIETEHRIPLLGNSSIVYTNNGGAPCDIVLRVDGDIVSTTTLANGELYTLANNFQYNCMTIVFAAKPLEHTAQITWGEINWDNI